MNTKLGFILAGVVHSGASSMGNHKADFNITACSCYHGFQLQSPLRIGTSFQSHTHFAYTML